MGINDKIRYLFWYFNFHWSFDITRSDDEAGAKYCVSNAINHHCLMPIVWGNLLSTRHRSFKFEATAISKCRGGNKNHVGRTVIGVSDKLQEWDTCKSPVQQLSSSGVDQWKPGQKTILRRRPRGFYSTQKLLNLKLRGEYILWKPGQTTILRRRPGDFIQPKNC